jgi:hypothetical protein
MQRKKLLAEQMLKTLMPSPVEDIRVYLKRKTSRTLVSAKHKRKKRWGEVLAFTERNGEPVARFDSIIDAERITGISAVQIRKSMEVDIRAKGFYWVYLHDYLTAHYSTPYMPPKKAPNHKI